MGQMVRIGKIILEIMISQELELTSKKREKVLHVVKQLGLLSIGNHLSLRMAELSMIQKTWDQDNQEQLL